MLRWDRRAGHKLWIALCMMIILGLMTTVVFVSMARPHRVGDVGETGHQFATLSPPTIAAASN